MKELSASQCNLVNGGWISALVKSVKRVIKYVAKSNQKTTTVNITAASAGAGAGVGTIVGSNEN